MLGEVVGVYLAMGYVLVQSLLASGAIVSVIRCSVGAPSECRVSSASLTYDQCDPSISGTRNRFDSPFGFVQRTLDRKSRILKKTLRPHWILTHPRVHLPVPSVPRSSSCCRRWLAGWSRCCRWRALDGGGLAACLRVVLVRWKLASARHPGHTSRVVAVGHVSTRVTAAANAQRRTQKRLCMHSCQIDSLLSSLHVGRLPPRPATIPAPTRWLSGSVACRLGA